MATTGTNTTNFGTLGANIVQKWTVSNSNASTNTYTVDIVITINIPKGGGSLTSGRIVLNKSASNYTFAQTTWTGISVSATQSAAGKYTATTTLTIDGGDYGNAAADFAGNIWCVLTGTYRGASLSQTATQLAVNPGKINRASQASAIGTIILGTNFNITTNRLRDDFYHTASLTTNSTSDAVYSGYFEDSTTTANATLAAFAPAITTSMSATGTLTLNTYQRVETSTTDYEYVDVPAISGWTDGGNKITSSYIQIIDTTSAITNGYRFTVNLSSRPNQLLYCDINVYDSSSSLLQTESYEFVYSDDEHLYLRCDGTIPDDAAKIKIVLGTGAHGDWDDVKGYISSTTLRYTIQECLLETVGSSTQSVSVVVPDSCKPVLSDASLHDANGYYEIFGGYLNSLSAPYMTYTETISYGAAIRNRAITYKCEDAESYSPTPITYTQNRCDFSARNWMDKYGYVRLNVTDGRSQTGAISSDEYYIYQYSQPTFESSVIAYRSDENGVADAYGEHIAVNLAWNKTSLMTCARNNLCPQIDQWVGTDNPAIKTTPFIQIESAGEYTFKLRTIAPTSQDVFQMIESITIDEYNASKAKIGSNTKSYSGDTARAEYTYTRTFSSSVKFVKISVQWVVQEFGSIPIVRRNESYLYMSLLPSSSATPTEQNFAEVVVDINDTNVTTYGNVLEDIDAPTGVQVLPGTYSPLEPHNVRLTLVDTVGKTAVYTEIVPLTARPLSIRAFDLANESIEAYPLSGETELSSDWLSLTAGGEPLTPVDGNYYILLEASENYEAGDLFVFRSTAYVPVANRWNRWGMAIGKVAETPDQLEIDVKTKINNNLDVGDSTHPAYVSSYNSFEIGSNPSSNSAAEAFIIKDVNGSIMGRLGAYYWASGYEGIRLGNSRTPAGGSAVGHYLIMGIDASGNRRVLVSAPDSWCTALGLGTVVDEVAGSSGTIAVASATATNIMSVTLGAGTWVITGTIAYQGGSSTTAGSYMHCRIGTTSTGNQIAHAAVGCVKAGNTQVTTVGIKTFSSSTTVYLSAQQGTGNSVNVAKANTGIKAVRVSS